MWFSRTSPRPAFFTTTTRVWELGLGALLAVALAGRDRPATPARGSAALGWGALVALAVVAAALPEGIEWPSAWALLPTVPTAVLIWVGWQGARGGPVRLLGTRPMVWVGGLSYSIYLWHWPVIVLGEWSADAVGATLPSWGKLALAVVAVVPAWLSWRYVETPIHHGPWLRDRPRALLAAGLALSLAGVLAALPLLPLRSPIETSPPGGRMPSLTELGASTVRPNQPPPAVDDPGWLTPDPLTSGEDRPEADVDHCQVAVGVSEPVACTFGDPAGTTTVALVGDSKAMQWLPALQEAGRAAAGGSSRGASRRAPSPPPPRPRRARPIPSATPGTRRSCEAVRADPPDVVVTSGMATGAWTDTGAARRPMVEGYAARWRSLADGGVPVVVIGDSPLSPDDLDVCADRHPHELTRCAFPAVPSIAGSALPVQREAAAAAGPGVSLVDLTAWICPGGSARSSSATSRSTGPVTTSPRRTPRRWPRRSAWRSTTPSPGDRRPAHSGRFGRIGPDR